MKYKYQVVKYWFISDKDLIDKINLNGERGWCVSSVIDYGLYIKVIYCFLYK